MNTQTNSIQTSRRRKRDNRSQMSSLFHPDDSYDEDEKRNDETVSYIERRSSGNSKEIVYQNPSEEFYSRNRRIDSVDSKSSGENGHHRCRNDQKIRSNDDDGHGIDSSFDSTGYHPDAQLETPLHDDSYDTDGEAHDRRYESHHVIPAPTVATPTTAHCGEDSAIVVRTNVKKSSSASPSKRPRKSRKMRCKCRRRRPSSAANDRAGRKPCSRKCSARSSPSSSSSSSTTTTTTTTKPIEIDPPCNLFSPNHPTTKEPPKSSDSDYMRKMNEWKAGILKELRRSLADCCDSCRTKTLQTLDTKLGDIQKRVTTDLNDDYKSIAKKVVDSCMQPSSDGRKRSKPTNSEDVFQVQLDDNLCDYFKKVVFKLSDHELPSTRPIEAASTVATPKRCNNCGSNRNRSTVEIRPHRNIDRPNRKYSSSNDLRSSSSRTQSSSSSNSYRHRGEQTNRRPAAPLDNDIDDDEDRRNDASSGPDRRRSHQSEEHLHENRHHRQHDSPSDRSDKFSASDIDVYNDRHQHHQDDAVPPTAGDEEIFDDENGDADADDDVDDDDDNVDDEIVDNDSRRHS